MQCPTWLKKFPTYDSFASATLTDIYTQSSLQQAQSFQVNYLDSAILINDGKAHFKVKPLPELSQILRVLESLALRLTVMEMPTFTLFKIFITPREKLVKWLVD